MSEAARLDADASPGPDPGPPCDTTSGSDDVLGAYWSALERGEAADLDSWLGIATVRDGDEVVVTMLNTLRLLHRHRARIQPDGRGSHAAESVPTISMEYQTEPNRPGQDSVSLPDAAWLAARDLSYLGPLGAGGMGAVFLAWHGGLKREVIVKVARDPSQDMRFRREIEIQVRLGGHPSLAVVHTAGEYAGRPCLVAEHVVGVDLRKLVSAQGPLPINKACAYMRQAALGLEHAHSRGVVHRDVKPANLVRSDEDGAVRVIDWGLAKVVDGTGRGDEMTSPGTVLGTRNYCAPEQFEDAAEATHQSDLYSLGCTFYELLCGYPPFVGHADLVRAHFREAVPPLPPELGVPPAIEKVVRRLLHKRSQDRYASAAEFIGALDATLAGRPVAGPGSKWIGVGLAGVSLLAAGLAVANWLLPWEGRSPEGSKVAGPEIGRTPNPGISAGIPSITVNSVGMALALVPGGEFVMGTNRAEHGQVEGPAHLVRISKRFLVGKYEVTQGEYEAVIGFNPSHFAPNGKGAERVRNEDARRLPVETVSWGDAIKFCNALSGREMLSPYYKIIDLARGNVLRLGGTGYRLPTEAEWEYACRAGTTGRYCFGEGDTGDDTELGHRLGEYSWHSGNSDDRTHEVGKKRPNTLGLYDMNGNVNEWVWDGFAPDYYRQSPIADPQGPDDVWKVEPHNRINRFGSFASYVEVQRNTSRHHTGPLWQSETIGFRVVRNLE